MACWGGVLVGLVWLVWPLLSNSQTLAFRDAGHYYYRLFQWQHASFQQGEGLRWNPLENLGQSLHGDATASLYYPPKAWLLGGDSGHFTLRWNFYLIAHLLWAAVGAAWLGRCLGVRGVGNALIALTYAGSGVVLIQLCNVIYLVGAAWMPWAIGSGLLAVVGPSGRWAAAGGACLAMMVLGGDPQSAYHVMLVLAVRVLFPRQEKTGPDVTSNRQGWSGRRIDGWRPEDVCRRLAVGIYSRRWPLVILASMAGAGLWLSWIQIGGSLAAAGHSERNLWQLPRSCWEVPAYLERSTDLTPQQRMEGSLSGLVGIPQPGTHHDFAFQFSLPPWQLSEWIWPNVSGRVYPQHRRWTQQIPAADRVWFPSLYAGALTFGLALAMVLRRSPQPNDRWLKWIAGGFLLGAFGWYGLGWVGKELWVGLGGGDPETYPVGGPVGSVYWLMTVCLPGYVQFRYPAKLMLVVTLMLSCLAGRGWQTADSPSWFSARRTLGGLVLLSLGGLVASGVGYVSWHNWVRLAPPDAVFGPLDVTGAWSDLQRSLWQGLLIVSLGWGLLLLSSRWSRVSRPVIGCCFVCLTALDLGVAHRELLPTAPVSTWSQPSVVATAIQEERNSQDRAIGSREARLPIVVFRGTMDGWLPSHWWQTNDPQRLTAVVDWDSQSLFPKHHLRSSICLVESPGAITDARHWILMHRSRQKGVIRPDGMREPPLEWLSVLGAEYLIVPPWSASAWSRHFDALPIRAGGEDWPVDVLLLRNLQVLPPTWVVESADEVPFEFGSDLALAWQQSEHVLWDPSTGELRDFRQQVVVHDPLVPVARSHDTQALTASAGASRILNRSNEHVVLAAELDVPGWVVVAQSFDEGWQALVEDLDSERQFSIPVQRVNGVMRGFALPAGKYRIQMTYQPPHWHRDMTLWGLGWLGWVGCLCAGLVRRWGRKNSA